MELHLQWPTNIKSYTVYRTAPFFNDLEQPTGQFSTSRHSLTLKFSQTAKDTVINVEFFLLSFTPGSKPTFSTNPSHLRFLLLTGLPHDNGTGLD